MNYLKNTSEFLYISISVIFTVKMIGYLCMFRCFLTVLEEVSIGSHILKYGLVFYLKVRNRQSL